MTSIQKTIFKTKIITETPPSNYTYNILKGTQICKDGYVDIGGEMISVAIYTTELRTSWVEGTQLWLDNALTIPVPNAFYKSITGGSIDAFFFNILSGAITNYSPPMTGC